MNKQGLKFSSEKPIRGTYRIGRATVLLLLAALAAGVTDGHAIDSTATVTQVRKSGTFTFVYATVNGKPQSKEITVDQGDGSEEVAQKLKNAIPGATVKGTKVTWSGGNAGSEDVVTDVVVIRGNSDSFSFCPGTECPVAGILAFDANPFNGQDTLVADATVTAGFANGLSPVSFEGLAGESIFNLASTLNTDLDNAGYVTRLVDSHDIEVFANGAQSPTELDLTVTPEGLVADRGILVGVNSPTPEPASLLLFGSGLFGLGATFRRRLRMSRGGAASSPLL